MSLNYRIIPVTPFQQNCSLIWCEKTRRAAVVDPGGDLEKIRAAVAEEDVTVEKILLTHAHIDHAGGTAELSKELGIPIEGPQKEDNFWIVGLPQQAQMFGFRPRKFSPRIAGWKMGSRSPWVTRPWKSFTAPATHRDMWFFTTRNPVWRW